jgi:GntR family transcriptional regulator
VARPRHEAHGDAAAGLVLDADRPKGEQIRAALTSLVQSSRAGMLLPSERVLAEHFDVARMTVRSCLVDLESQGLVERIPGRGTFVREPRVSHSEVFRSFSEDMRRRGMKPGSRDLSIRTRGAGRELAERLGIEPGSPVFHVERVRTADGKPMAVERTNLSADRFPGLERWLDTSASLYQVLGEEFGVRLESAEQRVSIARLSAREAAKLDTAPRDPAFLIERRSMDNMGHTIEFGRSLYRADRYEILMHVSHRDIPD